MSLTNFPHGITSFGIPVLGGGGLPPTFGDVYFVDYNLGSDDNDGKAPDRALKTLSEAHDNHVTTNNNDIILINGYAEVVETAMIDFSKSRVHVIGCNGWAPFLGYGAGARVSLGVTTAATDLGTLKNTGVRNTFTGIKFSNSNTLATCLSCVVEAGEYTRYNHCEFYKSSLLTTNLSNEVTCNGDSSQWYGCTFGDLVNERGDSGKERPNVNFDREVVSGKVCRDCSFVGCTFLHKAADAAACFMYGHSASAVERRLLIKDCVFWNCVLASADVADAVNFSAAQTAGDVLIINSHCVNCTAIAGANLNIYVGSYTAQTTDGISEEIAA